MIKTVVCRFLGFMLGKAQCCSALGSNGTASPILFSNFNCIGNESSPQLCLHETAGQCRAEKYASVLCLATPAEEGE